MSALQPGQRIGSYLLEALVGTGSFGQVWRARHHMFDEHVAIKVPTDADYVQNLRREGVAIHGLRHANIVRAIDLDPYSDPPYLVMEFVKGDSLRAVIDAHPKGLPIEAAREIMLGVLRAMETAHKAGVIHRDIKPANILLTKRANEVATVTELCVKVADFGLGRVGGLTTQSIMQSGNDLTGQGSGVAGTLAYMAPEQKEGIEVDGRADLYSCGIVLFEMLTGERPQGAEVPSSLRAEVPRWLDTVFEECYVRRDRRFASASKMIDALAVPGARSRAENSATDGQTCPSCHRMALRDDQFCIQCGVQLAMSVPRCGACNAHVQASDCYCIFCGNDLRVKAG